jgi:regulatory protein
MQNSDYEQGLKYSLRLLKSRMYSERKLEEKLLKRGIENRVGQEIIKHLRDHKLLDDKAYADSIIRSAARHRSASTKMIKYKLMQKGIDKSIAEERLVKQDSIIPSEKERAQELARKWRMRHAQYAGQASERDRLGAFLQRQGFGYSTIREIIS